MKKKEHSKKSFFGRKSQSVPEDEFQIISNDELFEDVADYDEESGEYEEYPEEDGFHEPESDEERADEERDEAEERPVEKEADRREEFLEHTENSDHSGEHKESEDSGNAGEKSGTDETERAEDEEAPDETESHAAKSEASGSADEEEDESEKLDDTKSEANTVPAEDDNGAEDGPEELEEDEIVKIDLDDEEDKEPTEAEIALKKHRRRKRILIGMFSFIGLVAAAYLGASAYFYSHFYYNTKINGTDVSMNTVEQVQDHMAGEVAGYSLMLVELGGKKEYINGTDISLKYVRDHSLKKLLEKQNPFLWVTAFWQPAEIEASVGVEYDKEQLEKVISQLTCMKAEEQTPSVSAKPEFKETQFEIKEEEIGTQINNERFVEAVNESISGFLPELDLKESECYIPPKYTAESPEVAQARDAMNSYLGANITLDFTPYTEVVDATVISQWIHVDENMQVTFNQEAVKGYIAGLAEKYDTYGRPRDFTTGFGNTVQVEGGSYGWQIDQEAEYNTLTANIQNGETVTREPNYVRRGATHEGNDFGNTYAEVDLSNQHMFYFKDGQCVLQSDIVTGNPNKGHATPQGVYMLAYKARDQVLRGKKLPDGSYEYESPVSYWMPFNGGIGFHDATWQSAFGGSRYQTYGSHGCINMPSGAAAELYGYIEAGIPVVCHY